MSTLSEYTGNGNLSVPSLRREETKVQLDGVLRHFEVLPSRLDRFMFKYIYVYLFGLFFLFELLNIISLLGMNLQVGEVLLQVLGFSVPPTLAIIVALWRFNVWRMRTPRTLRDLIENKRISVPDGDANTSYLCFLAHYRDALASPKRYFLGGLLMIVFVILQAFVIVQILSNERPNIYVTTTVVANLLVLLYYLGGFYCIGISTWTIYISGGYVRKLVRAFQLSIQPFHPDQCGGLKLLGNFCFGLGSPLLMASGLLIGYSMFALLVHSPGITSVAYLASSVYFPLLTVLLFILPVIILGFIFPLRDIHRKMVSEGKTNEHCYFMRTEALRQEIQALLAVKQIEAARAVQEELALVETLYTPYPTWPFHVRSKISKTVFEVSVSLLIGLITAALVQYFFPAILTLLLHTS